MPERETASRRPWEALDLLRVRDFRIWWLGFIAASFALAMQTLGLGWLAVQTAARDGGDGRAALYLGLVGLARVIPALGLGLVGGATADRLDRRSVMVGSQLATGIATLVLAVVAIGGQSSIVWLVGAAGVMSAASGFYVPARQAIQPRLVGETRLMRAFGFNVAAINGAALGGPLIGGVVIATAGSGPLLLASGTITVVIAASLLMLSPQPAPAESHGRRAGWLIREGLAYVMASPIVLGLMAVSLAAIVLVRPYLELLPVFVTGVLGLGPVELSWLLAASGVGALASGFVITALADLRRRGAIVVFGAITAGAALTVLAAQRELGPSIVVAFGTGFSMMLSAAAIGVIIQQATPDRLRGRVIATQSLLDEAGVPAGTMLLGMVAAAVGIDVALRAAGLGLVTLGVLAALRMPSLLAADLGPTTGAEMEPA